MDGQSLEEWYLDVLPNLEFGIIQVARRHPKMSDWEALAAVEALMQVYRAEATGHEARPPKLDPLAKETCDIVESMCEWWLGRGQLVNDVVPSFLSSFRVSSPICLWGDVLV
jgi:hypothetical protein